MQYSHTQLLYVCSSISTALLTLPGREIHVFWCSIVESCSNDLSCKLLEVGAVVTVVVVCTSTSLLQIIDRIRVGVEVRVPVGSRRTAGKTCVSKKYAWLK